MRLLAARSAAVVILLLLISGGCRLTAGDDLTLTEPTAVATVTPSTGRDKSRGPEVVAAIAPTYVAIAPAAIPAVTGSGTLAVIPGGNSTGVAPVTADLGDGWVVTALLHPTADRALAARIQRDQVAESSSSRMVFELHLYDAESGGMMPNQPTILGVRPPSGVDPARLVAFAVEGGGWRPLVVTLAPASDAVVIASSSAATIVVMADPPTAREHPRQDHLEATTQADTPLPRAPLPSRLIIPSMGVDAPVVPLALEDDGVMASPDAAHLVGWYELGPRPGEPSNAILVGHVDWSGKAGVFSRLRDLRPGQEVVVKSGLDIQFRYVVNDIRRYRAEEAPLEEVFGDTPGAGLTLITCDGEFDRARRQYVDRIVVRATGI